MMARYQAPAGAIAVPGIDVLVVGAGPAGVALATNLRRRGIDVLLVERASRPTTSLRGEYFQPLAVQLSHELGLGWLFDAAGAGSIREFHFRDLDGERGVRSDLLMRLEPGITGKTLPHPVLLSELWKYARAVLGADFRTGVTVRPETDARLALTCPPAFRIESSAAEVLRVRPRWVVGCDGRNSMVRSWIEGPRRPRRPHTVGGVALEFLVGAEIPELPRDPSRYILLRSRGRGTVVTFALGGARQRLYWNTPGVRRAEPGLKRQWKEEMQQAMDEVGAIHDLGPISSAVSAAPAETVWFGGVARGSFLLAGDAAAVTTALGGQGLALALQHVSFLLDLVDWKETRGERIAQMGRRYETAVRKAFDRVDIINQCIYHMFFSRSAALRPLVAQVLSFWNKDRAIADLVLRRFAGLDLRITSLRDLAMISGLVRTLRRDRALHGQSSLQDHSRERP